MKIFKSIKEWIEFHDKNLEKKSLGFVPTMGALHNGHLSLVEKSKSENDLTLVSIYLNPTQFNDKSDLARYPVDIERDIKLLEKINTDFLILPEYKEIYSDDYKYKISESDLSKILCGEHRPGHFDGVLTIVMKLLNFSRANNAYFGEKDYQQYLLIRGMCEAFFLKTKIIPCQIIREEDGLAMSSRNALLTKDDRLKAPLFNKILISSKTANDAENELFKNNFKVDYVIDINDRRFGAVFLGKVRLIDNVKI